MLAGGEIGPKWMNLLHSVRLSRLNLSLFIPTIITFKGPSAIGANFLFWSAAAVIIEPNLLLWSQFEIVDVHLRIVSVCVGHRGLHRVQPLALNVIFRMRIVFCDDRWQLDEIHSWDWGVMTALEASYRPGPWPGLYTCSKSLIQHSFPPLLCFPGFWDIPFPDFMRNYREDALDAAEDAFGWEHDNDNKERLVIVRMMWRRRWWW